MNPETIPLVAAFVAVGAVLAAIGALVLMRFAGRTRRRVQRAGRRAAAAARDAHHQASTTRERLVRAETDLVRLRERSSEADARLMEAIDGLEKTRSVLTTLTSGPVEGLIRVAGWLSQAARLAMLWR